MLIDTHAHLMFPEFKDDLSEVLQRAAESGVGKIVNVGCGVDSSREAVEMAGSERTGDLPRLFATVALHPYDADQCSEELMGEWGRWIEKDRASGGGKIVAIGETGLDYFKSKVEPEVQRASFRRHLQLAQKYGLPVIVHNREADEDCLEILNEFSSVPAVFHCYGSSLEFAKKVWDRGYITSFTGIITFPNAAELRGVVKAAPMDKFFLETDCPYLAPQSMRGKRNEPSYVVEVAKCVAEVKCVDVDEVARNSGENAQKFFGI